MITLFWQSRQKAIYGGLIQCIHVQPITIEAIPWTAWNSILFLIVIQLHTGNIEHTCRALAVQDTCLHHNIITNIHLKILRNEAILNAEVHIIFGSHNSRILLESKSTWNSCIQRTWSGHLAKQLTDVWWCKCSKSQFLRRGMNIIDFKPVYMDHDRHWVQEMHGWWKMLSSTYISVKNTFSGGKHCSSQDHLSLCTQQCVSCEPEQAYKHETNYKFSL